QARVLLISLPDEAEPLLAAARTRHALPEGRQQAAADKLVAHERAQLELQAQVGNAQLPVERPAPPGGGEHALAGLGLEAADEPALAAHEDESAAPVRGERSARAGV